MLTRTLIIGAAASLLAGVRVITNGPAPDTAANRKLYRPASRAGQRSAPKGN